MYAPERQQQILRSARSVGRVEVVALADSLRVTPETIRRDLTALERMGLVRRVHGGALPVERAEAEPTVAMRLGKAGAAKRRIAARAIEQIPRGGTVLLDSGTTTQAIADLLPADLDVTIVTNSFTIAAGLHANPGVTLLLLGGRVRRRTGAAVGVWLEQALSDLCLDVAFLGTNGYSLAGGLTTPDLVEGAAKRAMVAATRRAIVVADSSKAGQVQLDRFAQIEQLAMLITDTGLDDETAEQIDAAGADVVRA